MKYGTCSGKRWEPLSHHTVVHNVTQARPGWSVAPTSIQGRKQESILLIFPICRSVKFDSIHYNKSRCKINCAINKKHNPILSYQILCIGSKMTFMSLLHSNNHKRINNAIWIVTEVFSIIITHIPNSIILL